MRGRAGVPAIRTSVISVPATKYSSRAASSSPSNRTRRTTTPGGGAGAREGAARWSRFMTSCHTGAAPETPETSHIGSPEKLPTHTPTV